MTKNVNRSTSVRSSFHRNSTVSRVRQPVRNHTNVRRVLGRTILPNEIVNMVMAHDLRLNPPPQRTPRYRTVPDLARQRQFRARQQQNYQNYRRRVMPNAAARRTFRTLPLSRQIRIAATRFRSNRGRG